MIIRNQKQLQRYQNAVDLTTDILFQLREKTQVGIYPIEIDQLAGRLIKKYGVESAFFPVPGHNGIYGYNTCISVNDVAVHGIPSKTDPIKPGDIVKVDFGIIQYGYCTDFCFTVGVKPV